jgi:hypothetical protein
MLSVSYDTRSEVVEDAIKIISTSGANSMRVIFSE